MHFNQMMDEHGGAVFVLDGDDRYVE